MRWLAWLVGLALIPTIPADLSINGIASLPGLLLTIGVVVLVVGAIGLVYFKRGNYQYTVPAVLGGAGLVFLGYFIGVAVPPTTTVAPAPPASSLTTYIAGTYPAGDSVNTQTNTLTVYLVYNRTSSCWGIPSAVANQSTFRTGGPAGCTLNYVELQLKSARADLINATYGFTYNWASLPTFTTTSGTITTYSFVGYKAATSTAPAQWQGKWGSGSASGVYPNGAAPTTTTNLISTVIGIGAFNSAICNLQLPLGGGNSTSAPYASFLATTLYTPYTLTVTVANSNPSTFTVAFVVLGSIT